ncbi:MAG TPA: 1,4-dihydroxy-2-naphthoate polyprenyltransferase [Kineosporiaceae bacterium]|nr:1,4-dihydroxy-2-naphthoate polyprenyltransferase [Kineosporiaceae bacterium]
MATTTQWVAGARLRTLPLAVAPVVVGTGAAIGLQHGLGLRRHTELGINFCDNSWNCGFWGWDLALRAVLALIVSLALQVAVNYANDYSDGIRGTDDDRVGPFRLTGSRAATPEAVKQAAFGAFGVAAVAGLALVALSGTWWLLIVGVGCILAAWYYTGGRRPYGYAGLGEIAVFVFFGLVAVLGTTYTQAGTVSWAALAGAIGIGSLACAVLVANNLRDIPTDSLVGKITLAVRLGDAGTRRFYLLLIAAPFLAALAIVPGHPWAALALLAIPLAVPAARTVIGGAQGLALLPALKDASRLSLVYAVLLGVGLAL